VSLAEQFRAAVTGAFATEGSTLDLLPLVFVRAALAVLPADGAGVSLTGHLRVPIAASDEHVVAAERLQTTIGDGPCLTAVTLGRPLAADLATMALSWPTYHERFVAETPYRSVASLPLRSGEGSYLGALDLYSAHPAALTSVELEAIDAAVASPIAGMLFNAAAREAEGSTLPGWMSGAGVDDRLNVWVAIGMSMALLDLGNDDALALLRGYAYSHSLSLDQVARQMTDQGLDPEELLA
jgi:hypothetical protein